MIYEHCIIFMQYILITVAYFKNLPDDRTQLPRYDRHSHSDASFLCATQGPISCIVAGTFDCDELECIYIYVKVASL